MLANYLSGQAISGCGLCVCIESSVWFLKNSFGGESRRGCRVTTSNLPRLYWGGRTPLSLVHISVLLNAWLTVCKKTESWVKMVSVIVQQQCRRFGVGLVLCDTKSYQYCLSEQEKSSIRLLEREGGGNILRNWYICMVSCWMVARTAIFEGRFQKQSQLKSYPEILV